MAAAALSTTPTRTSRTLPTTPASPTTPKTPKRPSATAAAFATAATSVTMASLDPTLSLTLPSLHDGTPLDCRIYLPPSVLAVAGNVDDDAAGSSTAWTPDSPRWRGHAAVVAHPYAPMGGSYNDGIVKMVAQTLLSRPSDQAAHADDADPSEFVVATFNFRGAGPKPQGRTSWTAKAETADYMTVAGFLYYFVHYLDPYGDKEASASLSSSSPSSSSSSLPPPTLLLAGYSYGAMVTSLLPPLAAILAPFARPLRTSPAAEVRRRAARWAALQNADFAACRERVLRDLAAANAAKAAAANAAACPSPSSPQSPTRAQARLSMGVRGGGGGDDDGAAAVGSHHGHHLSFHHHGHGHGHHGLHHTHSQSQSHAWHRKSHDIASSTSTGGSAGNGSIGSLKQALASASLPRRSLSLPRRSLSAEHRRAGADADAAGEDDGRGRRHSSMAAALMARVRHGSGSRAGDRADKEDKNKDGQGANDKDAAAAAATAANDAKPEPPADIKPDKDHLPVVAPLAPMRPAFLLVSPPVGYATNLATLSFAAPNPAGLFRRKKPPATDPSVDGVGAGAGAADIDVDASPDAGPDSKLAANPTLVVYGAADAFVTARKMRHWTDRLAQASARYEAAARQRVATSDMSKTFDPFGAHVADPPPARLFRSLEIATAGHFWAEGRTLYELLAAVDAFATEVARRA